MRRLLALAVPALMAAALVVSAAPAEAGPDRVKKAQRRLNDLGCNAGPADGDVGQWTRSAVIRFQSRHGMKQTGKLTKPTRKRLYADDAKRCDRRPVPARSGTGRRIVISQRQNWVWLVGPSGRSSPRAAWSTCRPSCGRVSHRTGSYCGRAARIKRNTTTSGEVWLENFVRFAPCGIGFHRIPHLASRTATRSTPTGTSARTSTSRTAASG